MPVIVILPSQYFLVNAVLLNTTTVLQYSGYIRTFIRKYVKHFFGSKQQITHLIAFVTVCLAFLTFYPDISDLPKDVEFNGDPAVARVEAQAPQRKLKVSSLSAHVL